jgi:hypothetical protein
LLALVLCKSTGNFGFWATVVRAVGPALLLFRIEAERSKLPAPFSRRIAKPLNADAAGQATFYGCFDETGSKEGKRGAVAELVGIEGGVVSGVINLESSGVEASDWRPRHDEQ